MMRPNAVWYDDTAQNAICHNPICEITNLGVSKVMGDPTKCMVFVRGNPNLKWMIFRGTAIAGTPKIEQEYM